MNNMKSRIFVTNNWVLKYRGTNTAKKVKNYRYLMLCLLIIFISVFSGCDKESDSAVNDSVNTGNTSSENLSSENTSVDSEITPGDSEDASVGAEDGEVSESNKDESSAVEQQLPSFEEYGVWYEIFVRAFADSNGDGIGDLKGLVDKLDYLNDNDEETDADLGINGLWLMPINPSPSYHGYDVTDYYGINPEYGTMEEFELLISEAHKRNIKVIIDLVLNHSSSQHPWFQDALANEDSKYREFYRIESQDDENFNFKKQVWNHNVWHKVGDEYYYGIFWDQMPDLNYDNQALRDEMISVGKFWLEKGVDGFRIDAVSHVFGSGELGKGVEYEPKIDEWWNEFNSALREVNENYYLVGEAWEPIDARVDYTPYFDTTFNFDIAEAGLLTMVKNEVDFDVKNNGLIKELEMIYSKISDEGYTFIDAPFLSNHDQRRAMDYLNNDLADMKLASSMYLTLPGNPFIYYGEELGMLGNKPDEDIREPFIWGSGDDYQTTWKELDYNAGTLSVLHQTRVPDSLLNHYKKLIRLRSDNIALLEGAFRGVETESMKIIGYERLHDEQNLIVLHNLSSDSLEVELSEIGLEDSDVNYIYAFPYEGIVTNGKLTLPGKSTFVIEE